MTTATATKTRRKRCSECGELKDKVLGRQRLCEECEQDRDYCRICDYWHSGRGNGCRHIQWSNELGLLVGSGSDHIDAKDHRESFDLMLSKFAQFKTWEWNSDGKPLLPELCRLIKANRFWAQWHGPLIGGYPDLALRYSVRGQDYGLELRNITSSEQLAWGDEAIEQMQLGMSWLTSLDSKAKQANQITAEWIEQFLAKS